MALEESVEDLEKMESNGITAYIQSSLREYASGLGRISIDYVQQPGGDSGYVVTIGTQGDCETAAGSFCC